MFGIIKLSIILLINIVNASNHTQCVSLSIQKWQIQGTLINLHPNEYSQELRYYPFVVDVVNVLKTVIFFMTFLIKYVFQIKQNI